MSPGAEEQGAVIICQERGFLVINRIDSGTDIQCRAPVASAVAGRDEDIETADAFPAVTCEKELLPVTAHCGV